VVVNAVVAREARPQWSLRKLGDFEIRGQGSQELFGLDGHQDLDFTPGQAA
jgi:hypothetical protein